MPAPRPGRTDLLPIQRDIRAAADPARAAAVARFYKTGPGEYGEGDRFLGLTVPATRAIVRRWKRDLTIEDAESVLQSPWHEERLAALILLVDLHRAGDAATQREIRDLYLRRTGHVDNWDLVDVSAGTIAGPAPNAVRTRLARSASLWERRIAIVSTQHHVNRGDPSETFRIADLLRGDAEDLIHKATGWLLREAGKRCSEAALIDYLRTRPDLPRTSLRYAIERFPPARRKAFLAGRFD